MPTINTMFTKGLRPKKTDKKQIEILVIVVRRHSLA